MGGMFTASQDKHIEQLSHQKRRLVNFLIDTSYMESGIRPQHASYISPLGRINSPDLCKNFDYLNSQSQVLLKDTAYNNSLSFKEKILEIFYMQKFSYNDLKQAIRQSTDVNHLDKCLQRVSQKKARFMAEAKTDQETAAACCLVISFYTGNFQQTLARSSNILIKLESMNILEYIKGKKQLRNQICIAYWLLKAISYLPLFVNQVTRCINLSQAEEAYYEQGNLITWLQFSSGSQGQFIPFGLQKRNTRFHIFSITARKIAAYSEFEQAEKQILFKPFTHFLIIKKEKVDEVLHIYMRQVIIGQASLNILWVDDKICSPDWPHKKLVEAIIRQNPHITIIPKSSTKTAIAFMDSTLGKRRKMNNMRIITTLSRQYEENAAFSGVALLKELEEVYVANLKVLVLSDDVKGVENQMKKIVVRQPYVTISKNNDVLKSFVSFK